MLARQKRQQTKRFSPLGMRKVNVDLRSAAGFNLAGDQKVFGQKLATKQRY
jgi:hypothetical protein